MGTDSGSIATRLSRIRGAGLIAAAAVAVGGVATSGCAGGPRRPTTGTAIAAAGVVVPAAMAIYGFTSDIDEGGLGGFGAVLLMVGPAPGRWYAGRTGWQGLALRLGGAAIAMAGVSELDDADRCRTTPAPDCADASRTIGWGAIGVGVAAIVGSTIYDLATTPRTVRDWNRRHQLVVAPVAAPGMTGVSLAGRF